MALSQAHTELQWGALGQWYCETSGLFHLVQRIPEPIYPTPTLIDYSPPLRLSSYLLFIRRGWSRMLSQLSSHKQIEHGLHLVFLFSSLLPSSTIYTYKITRAWSHTHTQITTKINFKKSHSNYFDIHEWLNSS